MRSVCLALIAVTAYAADIRLSAGLTDSQVVQRGPANTADIQLAGVSKDLKDATIEARISSGNKSLKGWNWKPVARVASTTWTGVLSGVPAGGPYKVELRAASATPIVINDVFVGDLWVLAGHSNMEGIGLLQDVQAPDPRVRNFDMLDRWTLAAEPLHNLRGAVDPVHWLGNPPARLTGDALDKANRERRRGAGLALPFAVEMVSRTGIPIGLIPCAHGGTSMAQWDPGLKTKGGESLYGSMMRRIQAAGGKVKGVLWYQGESDATPKAAPLFAERFERFVSTLRTDLGDPKLPFYYVQVARHISVSLQNEWNTVQEAQRQAAARIANSAVVASVDLEMEDNYHIRTSDLKRIGIRLANVATGKAASPNVIAGRFDAPDTVRVEFASVTGRLVSQGRLAGFRIHDAAGQYLPVIYRAELDPASPNIVNLRIIGRIPDGAVLHYGWGKDPYCNLRDEADMAALVFGPIPIQR